MDHHKRPFENGTLLKLEIYQDYLVAWLQIFLNSSIIGRKPIHFYDFFSGPGKDNVGNNGSPLLLLKELRNQRSLIVKNRMEIVVHLNEKVAKKYENLVSNIEPYSKDHFPWTVKTENLEFNAAFEKLAPTMKNSINLIFLDQNGIKHVTSELFKSLTKMQLTDFMFFTSSSFISRFGNLPEFTTYCQIPKKEITGKNYANVHRAVVRFYRNLAPLNYYVSGFSIKKGSNIYGVIFCTGHWRGMQKFVDVAWKKDPHRGEANFDIDEEGLDDSQLDMFRNQADVVEEFQSNVISRIKRKELLNERDAYKYALYCGIKPNRLKAVYKQLEHDKLIEPTSALRISSNVMTDKSPRVINYIG